MTITWGYLEEDGVGAAEGLAVDESLMSRPGPTLRLYTYRSHCALVGKFQNLEAEVDLAFSSERGIAVNRRPTGGGAILMGDGQLGVAVVDSSRRAGVPEHPKEIFARYGAALSRGLARLGVEAGLEGKNDLRVRGRKIAGLGVCRGEDGTFLFHTSLLVDLDVDLMLRVLKVPAEKLSDKLRARVAENLTTLRRELGRPISIQELRAALLSGFADSEDARFEARPLSAEEQEAARRLEREKYRDPAWINRRQPTPDAQGTSLRKTPGGLVRLYVSLAGTKIKDVTITGDFGGEERQVLALEKALGSLPAEETEIRAAVDAHPIDGLDAEEVIAAVLEAIGEARKTSSQGGTYGCFVNTSSPLPREGERQDPFALRLENFGRAIHFHAPGLKRYATEEFAPAAPDRFTAVSLTGSRCALQCDHCKSSVLEGMRSIPAGKDLFVLAQESAGRGGRGLLVSGGMSAEGRVPHLEHLAEIVRIKRELGQKVIVHTGLVEPEAARALKQAGVDGAFIDVIGSAETIQKVYHLKKKSVDDFERSVEALVGAGLEVVPHIVLGLHYGRMLGEENALEIVARHGVAALILVILTPILSTPMRDAVPPSPEEIGAFFTRARLRLPDLPVYLGCARPGGAHKRETDRLAVDAGLNGIAYPAEGIIGYARLRGLEPELHESCCSIHDL